MTPHLSHLAPLNGNRALVKEIIIRKANIKDEIAIGEVLLDFYNMEDLKEATNSFLTEINKEHKYILAIENKKIIGLVTWILHGLPKHGLFELDRICILSGSRGKGIGNRLVEAMIDDADLYYKSLGEKIRKLYLLTHEENKPAHKFYEKVGFKHETTLIDHYYKDVNERVYSIFFNV